MLLPDTFLNTHPGDVFYYGVAEDTLAKCVLILYSAT